MNKLAPIVLFVYNRLEHTLKTVSALLKNELNEKSDLIIYADGPKHESDIQKVNEVKNYINSIEGFRHVKIIQRQKNYGLARNIVEGVTEVVNQYGKVIVLEDDIITSPGFLKYMNSALDLYENHEKVMHVSGYMYPVNTRKNGILFLRVLSCWGWATWKRAWSRYNDDPSKFIHLLNSDEKIREFNIGGNADFYAQLEANYLNKIKTWAVKWYASWYFEGGISIFPSRSLTSNTGHDGSGTNSKVSSKYSSEKLAESVKVMPKKVSENTKLKKKINQYMSSHNPGRIWKIKESIRKGLHGFLMRIIPELKLIYRNSEGLKNILHYGENNQISHKAKIDEPSRIYNTIIGEYSYISVNARISETSIGKFCSIGPNLLCGWGIHPLDGISTSPMFYSNLNQNAYSYAKAPKIQERRSISIGHDVFIGMNVTILDGVKIGNGAVIGAGSVVSKDIPDYAIAAGVPAKVIKYRFDDDTIIRLKNISWWDWDEKELYRIEKYFFNVQAFLEEVENL